MSEHGAASARAASARRVPLSVVAKPTGAACNLDCQYCFFLSKELLYDAPSQMMSLATLEDYVAQYLAASGDGEVTLMWQGGEPTMRGIDFYRTLIEMTERYRRPSQHVRHAMQTNATLITSEWAQFLAEHDVLVGVSVDGPPALHDVYRVNRARRGTHALVERGWKRLQKAGVELNVLCTVNATNQEHGSRVYRYLRDELGAQYMQFIPIVERVEEADLAAAEHGWRCGGAQHTERDLLMRSSASAPSPAERPGLLYRQHGTAVTSRSVRPEAYGTFLREVFDEWRQHDVGRIFVQDFDAALSSLFGIYPVCVHAPSCGNNLALEFNGDVYSCDHWVEPDWLLGNITTSTFAELVSTSRQRSFLTKKSGELSSQCRTCPVRRMCQGGCPKDRFVETGEGEPPQNYLCAGYFDFYTYARSSFVDMARLRSSGRPASDIMNLSDAEPSVPGQLAARGGH